MQFGFDSSRWEELARALKQHAKDNEITLEVANYIWDAVRH